VGELPSEAVATADEYVTRAPLVLVAWATSAVGHWSAGAWVSLTVTEKVHRATLPPESVAEAVTTVLPSGKVLPEAWLYVTGGLSATTSEAMAGP
jgi:hypothetical protein